MLVDGYAQVYRAFYAIPGLTAPDGRPTNALYGVIRLLLKLDQELPGGRGVVIFDCGRPQRRMDLLPDYKANRPPMPDALRAQLPELDQWLEALGWPVLRQEGREADDVIAAVAMAREGAETAIVTHDKDLMQLVVERDVYLVQTGAKGALDRIGPAEVEAKFGVAPGQIRDYLALLGDSSDNIPGVPGVGAKTAAALLKQFGSAEALLARIAEVAKPGIRKSLEENRNLLLRNLDLVRLDLDLPPDWRGLDALRRRPLDGPRLQDMAAACGFRSLAPVLAEAARPASQPSLFGF